MAKNPRHFKRVEWKRKKKTQTNARAILAARIKKNASIDSCCDAVFPHHVTKKERVKLRWKFRIYDILGYVVRNYKGYVLFLKPDEKTVAYLNDFWKRFYEGAKR